MGDGLVAHEPAVDEDVLRPASRPGVGQRRNVALDADAGRLFVDLNQIARVAVDLQQALPPAPGRGTLHQPPPGADQREAYVVRAQRELRDYPRHLRGFGLIRLEELAAGREVVEQVLDVDARAFRRACFGDRPEDAAVHLDLGAGHLASRARPQRQVRDRGNRRQRFAAKPQRRDCRQIAARPDLAGRVPLQRQLGVIRRHPLAVVFDAHQALAAKLDGHRDASGAGVDGVFDQLLDDRRRALDDLAGGDLVGELDREAMNLRHGYVSVSKSLRAFVPSRLRACVWPFRASASSGRTPA